MFDNLPQLPPGAEPKPAFVPFDGGIDYETPRLAVKAGRLRRAINYELGINGGYSDIMGYERFDGRPAPSAASAFTLDVTITGSLSVGDTVTGVTSTSTAVIIAIATHSGTSQQYIVVTKVTGNFTAETLNVSGSPEATTDGVFGVGDTDLLQAQYRNLAADEYRDDIAVVTGEDGVWGGFSLNGVKYAIRNKSGGATAGLYVQHATTGWTEVALGRHIAFTSGGTFEIEEGQTITGATSGATAVVTRIQVTSGTWGAGSAAGWITFATQTGTFQAENLNVGANLNVATIAGNSAAITLQPDGRLDHYVSNFVDAVNDRVYCADGVNNGWEFDGTVFAFIRTGMTTDTPTHVIVHRNQLFFSFGSSNQHSGPGDPMAWSVVLGAGELRTSGVVTGYQLQPGDPISSALTIGCAQQMYTLFGDDADNWNLVAYRGEIGAREWTMQSLARTLFLDNLGITDLATSDKYGAFAHSMLSAAIQTALARDIAYATASCVCRKKNQYRLFLRGSQGYYITMRGDALVGIMPVQLDHTITTMWAAPDANGEEEIFFGTSDGYVMQMERGTSFDGASISAVMVTHFDSDKAIELWKGFFGPASIEPNWTTSPSYQPFLYASLSFTYYLDYLRSEISDGDTQTAELTSASVSARAPMQFALEGEGRNISFEVSKDSDYTDPVLLTGVHYYHKPTVPMRG